MANKEKTTPGRRARDARGPVESDDLELGLLPQLIARQLRIATLMAFKDFAMDVERSSLSPGSFEILELLSHNPGLGHSRLAAAIGLEKSSLVPAIARLEDLALVERKQSETDKRANELRITAKGRKVLAELRRYVLERDAGITSGMSREDVAHLNRLLKKFAASAAKDVLVERGNSRLAGVGTRLRALQPSPTRKSA
jgi:DNA-binding MarR family transcriptional regulator